MQAPRVKFPVLPAMLASALLPFCLACSGPEASPPADDASSDVAALPAPTGLAIAIPETEAGQVLAAALVKARATDRLLFVHSGADW